MLNSLPSGLLQNQTSLRIAVMDTTCEGDDSALLPQVWRRPGWPLPNSQEGVFVQLDSLQARRLWYLPYNDGLLRLVIMASCHCSDVLLAVTNSALLDRTILRL